MKGVRNSPRVFFKLKAKIRPESANAVLADRGEPTTIAGRATAIGVKERMFAAAEIHSFKLVRFVVYPFSRLSDALFTGMQIEPARHV
jgi:hypothetical protein